MYITLFKTLSVVQSLKLKLDAVGALRPDFTSKLVHVLAFGTPKFYIAPYDKIKYELVNLSSNCDVKSGLRVRILPAVSKSLIMTYIISLVKTKAASRNIQVCRKKELTNSQKI